MCAHVCINTSLQLFMIKQVRNYLLSVDGAADDFTDEDSEKMEIDVSGSIG